MKKLISMTTLVAAFALAGLGTTHAQLLQHLAECRPFNFH